MWRIALIYGSVLAGLALLLEWLQYRHFVRALPTQAYIVVLAIVFVALGICVGIRVKPARIAPGFERNTRAIASLGLTSRECEVLEALARGLSNKEIARELGISPNTVKTHIANLVGKLGVSGRGKAVEAARGLALIP